MTIDERLEAITVNLKLAACDSQGRKEEIQHLKELARQDGENILGLAGIADIHERRLTRLEGGDIQGQQPQ